MKSSSQDSDSDRERAIYFSSDGKMHDAFLDQFTKIKDFKIESVSPTKFEQGEDVNGNWFARAGFTIKIAEPIHPYLFGVDLAADGSLSSVSRITPHDENHKSELMDF